MSGIIANNDWRILKINTTGYSIWNRTYNPGGSDIAYAITIDYESLKNNDVTIRDRDTEKQIRAPIQDLKNILQKLLSYEIKFEKAGKLFKYPLNSFYQKIFCIY